MKKDARRDTMPVSSPGRQMEDKYVLRLPDGMRGRLKALAGKNCRSMNAEILTLIDRGLAAPLVIPPGEAPVLTAPDPKEREIDRLDRLTAIVDRTRLTLGREAAREMWPMLGLPVLRTSSPRRAAKETGPDLLDGLDQAPPDLPKAPAARSPKEWVSAFIAERCEADPKGELPAPAFREAYTTWANAMGAPIPLASSLGRYAANLGVRKRKSGGCIYVGLRLLPSAALPC